MFQLIQMKGGGIAPMLGKAILGIFAIEFLHDTVTRDFGKNTGCGYAEADSIPADQGRLLHRKSLYRQPIHQGMGGRMSVSFQPIQSSLHGKSRGTQNIEIANFPGTGFSQRIQDILVFQQQDKKRFSPAVTQFLGIIKSLKAKPLGKDHC